MHIDAHMQQGTAPAQTHTSKQSAPSCRLLTTTFVQTINRTWAVATDGHCSAVSEVPTQNNTLTHSTTPDTQHTEKQCASRCVALFRGPKGNILPTALLLNPTQHIHKQQCLWPLCGKVPVERQHHKV